MINDRFTNSSARTCRASCYQARANIFVFNKSPFWQHCNPSQSMIVFRFHLRLLQRNAEIDNYGDVDGDNAKENVNRCNWNNLKNTIHTNYKTVIVVILAAGSGGIQNLKFVSPSMVLQQGQKTFLVCFGM